MKKAENFGKALKELRKSKNINLADISKFSNINQEYFEEFEKGNFSFQEEVYIRLFLIEYVKYIDSDKTDQIINEFQNLFSNNKIKNNDLTFIPAQNDLEDVESEGNDFSLNSTAYSPRKIAIILFTLIVIFIIFRFVESYSK